jgi:RNA polymerase sigma factor (TIGR02999 family)
MEQVTPPDVSQLLQAWGQGDEAARDQLIPLVYDHLRKLARAQLRRERQGHTLQSGALINEAYLRLVAQPVAYEHRAQFFGIAAHLMRQVLVNHAVARRRLKRGGAPLQVSLSAAADVAETQAAEVLALDEALQTLARFDQQKSRIVELRFFGGLTIEETAAALGMSHATVEREWRAARAWLLTELSNTTS